jgi:hypothetical protein
MKKISIKKISVKKETITRLNSNQLERIVGGNNTHIQTPKDQTTPVQCNTRG